MSEFKPCPFCGVNDWQYHSHFSGATIRQCGECGTIVDEGVIDTRPIEDALNSRIVELKVFIDQLIEAGDDIADDYCNDTLTPYGLQIVNNWQALIKDWKEH